MFRFDPRSTRRLFFFFFCFIFLSMSLATSAVAADSLTPRSNRNIIHTAPAASGSKSLASPTGVTSIKKPVLKRRRRRSRRSTQFEIGLGYVQWNEALILHRLASRSAGYANYAGPALIFDVNRINGRWQFSAATILAAGNASAGGFSSDFNFSDGIERAWYALFLHPSAAYRFNQNVMAGLGLMARLRSADWEPSDQSIGVETKGVITYAPSINLRFTFVKLTILQSFAPSISDNSTQWTWTAQYIF
jgi:hypothetical protein